MLLFNKITKACRCWRCSTILVLFYLCLIGFILHNVTYKLQNVIISMQKVKVFANKDFGKRMEPTQVKTAKTFVHIPYTTIKEHEIVNSLLEPKSEDSQTELNEKATIIDKSTLYAAFKAADNDENEKLSLPELTVYINKKIVQHVDDAIRMNPREFRIVDIAPADGLISWEEYHRFFLKEHGITAADLDEEGRSKNRKTREDMARDKRRFSEAARTDLFSLTIDEYLSFRHPEASVTNLLNLVDDLLRQLDIDGDDMLTLEEFCDTNLNDDVELMQKTLISTTKKEREAEFKSLIDRNADGKADRRELLHYIDPKTTRYAKREAELLLNLCDDNHDQILSLSEFQQNAETLMASKMIDVAKSFHMDF